MPRWQGRLAWLALAALLAGAALAVHVAAGADALEWRPDRAWQQPWRFWTAAWVHYGDAHLFANLAGTALIGTLGAVARLPASAAAAWACAWPLTHGALLLRPSIAHYGGLSGVLHAGAAVVAIYLLFAPSKLQRTGAAVLLLGLLAKAGFEKPWHSQLPFSQALGIHVVAFAHAAGIAAGVACGWLLCRRGRR